MNSASKEEIANCLKEGLGAAFEAMDFGYYIYSQVLTIKGEVTAKDGSIVDYEFEVPKGLFSLQKDELLDMDRCRLVLQEVASKQGSELYQASEIDACEVVEIMDLKVRETEIHFFRNGRRCTYVTVRRGKFTFSIEKSIIGNFISLCYVGNGSNGGCAKNGKFDFEQTGELKITTGSKDFFSGLLDQLVA